VFLIETLLQSLLPPRNESQCESLRVPLSVAKANQTMIKQFASTLFWRKNASDGAATCLNSDVYTYFEHLFKVRRMVQTDEFTELIARECIECHMLLFQQWRDK
jgi:hypothetical protein